MSKNGLIQRLELRRLLSTAAIVDRRVIVDGTDGVESFVVASLGANQWRVTDGNGLSFDFESGPGKVRSIQISGAGGDDFVDTRATGLPVGVIAGAGVDVVYTGAGPDWLRLGDGDDWANAGSGDDRLDGEAGNDKLFGDPGMDRLVGGTGRDHLRGDAGNDTLVGNGGRDTLRGERDDDVLYGNAGNDVLFGCEDDNTLYGGDGDDTFYCADVNTTDRLFGEAGTDSGFVDNADVLDSIESPSVVG
jgi:Ca2+-binding RTX toxin-like protein